MFHVQNRLFAQLRYSMFLLSSKNPHNQTNPPNRHNVTQTIKQSAHTNVFQKMSSHNIIHNPFQNIYTSSHLHGLVQSSFFWQQEAFCCSNGRNSVSHGGNNTNVEVEPSYNTKNTGYLHQSALSLKHTFLHLMYIIINT